jgi:hypothetical protein
MNMHPELNSLESALRFRQARAVVREVGLEMVQLETQLSRWDNAQEDYHPDPHHVVVLDPRFERNSALYEAVEIETSEDAQSVVQFRAQRADGTIASFDWKHEHGIGPCPRYQTLDTDGHRVVVLDPRSGLLLSFEKG